MAGERFRQARLALAVVRGRSTDPQNRWRTSASPGRLLDQGPRSGPIIWYINDHQRWWWRKPIGPCVRRDNLVTGFPEQSLQGPQHERILAQQLNQTAFTGFHDPD